MKQSYRIPTVAAVLLLMAAFQSCAYRPILNQAATQDGLASYYSDQFNGRKTASGEIFDNSAMTAAHRSFPFGTTVRVTNLENDESVVVRINDRGPVKPERIIDLSRAAAEKIGLVRAGICRVRLDVIEWGGLASK